MIDNYEYNYYSTFFIPCIFLCTMYRYMQYIHDTHTHRTYATYVCDILTFINVTIHSYVT